MKKKRHFLSKLFYLLIVSIVLLNSCSDDLIQDYERITPTSEEKTKKNNRQAKPFIDGEYRIVGYSHDIENNRDLQIPFVSGWESIINSNQDPDDGIASGGFLTFIADERELEEFYSASQSVKVRAKYLLSSLDASYENRVKTEMRTSSKTYSVFYTYKFFEEREVLAGTYSFKDDVYAKMNDSFIFRLNYGDGYVVDNTVGGNLFYGFVFHQTSEHSYSDSMVQAALEVKVKTFFNASAEANMSSTQRIINSHFSHKVYLYSDVPGFDTPMTGENMTPQEFSDLVQTFITYMNENPNEAVSLNKELVLYGDILNRSDLNQDIDKKLLDRADFDALSEIHEELLELYKEVKNQEIRDELYDAILEIGDLRSAIRHGSSNSSPNVSIYDELIKRAEESLEPKWSNVLKPGEILVNKLSYLSNSEQEKGKTRIISSNGKFELFLQNDGNLVLYKQGRAIWALNRYRPYGVVRKAVMQTDGNFVLYEGSKVIWATNTYRSNRDAYLVLQNDGNLVMYRKTGGAIWASNTSGR